jgi:hypothetical protein
MEKVLAFRSKQVRGMNAWITVITIFDLVVIRLIFLLHGLENEWKQFSKSNHLTNE